MTRRTTKLLATLAGGVLLFPLLAGCSTKTPELSKEEQAKFKGGPMPDSARKIFEQKMREAQQKSTQSNVPPNAGAPH